MRDYFARKIAMREQWQVAEILKADGLLIRVLPIHVYDQLPPLKPGEEIRWLAAAVPNIGKRGLALAQQTQNRASYPESNEFFLDPKSITRYWRAERADNWLPTRASQRHFAASTRARIARRIDSGSLGHAATTLASSVS